MLLVVCSWSYSYIDIITLCICVVILTKVCLLLKHVTHVKIYNYEE